MSGILNKLEKKNTAIDEEFDNFMLKVNEVKMLMTGLTSKDRAISNGALKIVDDYLGNSNRTSEDIDEDSLRIKASRTVINQKAFDSMNNQNDQSQTQNPEDFMRICEQDAKQRAEERRLGKEASDGYKKHAITAFNNCEFEKALSLYNKAINEFRGSAHLYLCRALTYLKLKLYHKAIEDSDLVLRCFDEKSLKAFLYKAKAYKELNEENEAKKCVQEAIQNHPKCEVDIREYIDKNSENK